MPGTIEAVHGSIVDVRFPPGDEPVLRESLEVLQEGARPLVPEAVVSAQLDAIADALDRQARRRRDQVQRHRGVLADLAWEAMRRLVREGES